MYWCRYGFWMLTSSMRCDASHLNVFFHRKNHELNLCSFVQSAACKGVQMALLPQVPRTPQHSLQGFLHAPYTGVTVLHGKIHSVSVSWPFVRVVARPERSS